MRTRSAYSWATTAEREFLLWIRITHPEIRLTMKTKSITVIREPSESEIQHAAYLLWIESGRPEGCDLNHWLAAKEMLCHRHGRDASTRRPVPEIAAPAPILRPGKN
jgi:hypothetical protein